MPITANLVEEVIEPLAVPVQVVSRVPIWEITDVFISNKNKYINVSVDKGYYNDNNEYIILSKQVFTITDSDFMAMATAVINNQTFYSAMKSTLYNYLLTKGFLSGTIN